MAGKYSIVFAGSRQHSRSLHRRRFAPRDYPDRLIKIVHGFPPGGNVDLIARLLAAEMQKSPRPDHHRSSSRPGLAGSVAAEAARPLRPRRLYADGRGKRARGRSARCYKNFKFKTVDDFEWISTGKFLSVPDLRAQRLRASRPSADVMKEASANPGALTYGSGRRRLDPAHHGRVARQRDQDQIHAYAISRRGAGVDRAVERRLRLHRGHHRRSRPRESNPVKSAR